MTCFFNNYEDLEYENDSPTVPSDYQIMKILVKGENDNFLLVLNNYEDLEGENNHF